MFHVNFSLIWSFNYFFFLFYNLFVFSFILYLLPNLSETINYVKFKKTTAFSFINGNDLYALFLTFFFFLLISNFCWSGPTITVWFGNLIFSNFQLKISYLILFIFNLVILVYCTSFYFSNKNIYDFIIINLNFFYWIIFIFFVNNVFALLFFLELISTLIFLLIIVSTFSSTYFYNNLDLNLYNYFNNNLPQFYLQTLLFFFWISLVTSLNLFFSIVLFYLKLLTFDWFVLEFVLFYIINLCSYKDLLYIFFLWFNFLFSVFLKCGLVPFFFWKPIFFKGVPLHSLFFYVFFFYFFLFIFFIYFFLVHLHEFFIFFSFVNVLLLIIGFFILISIMCETYYIKSFLAISSILNTLFVFLAFNASSSEIFIFI